MHRTVRVSVYLCILYVQYCMCVVLYSMYVLYGTVQYCTYSVLATQPQLSQSSDSSPNPRPRPRQLEADLSPIPLGGKSKDWSPEVCCSF